MMSLQYQPFSSIFPWAIGISRCQLRHTETMSRLSASLSRPIIPGMDMRPPQKVTNFAGPYFGLGSLHIRFSGSCSLLLQDQELILVRLWEWGDSIYIYIYWWYRIQWHPMTFSVWNLLESLKQVLSYGPQFFFGQGFTKDLPYQLACILVQQIIDISEFPKHVATLLCWSMASTSYQHEALDV